MKYTLFLEQIGTSISSPTTFRSFIGGWLPKDKWVDLPNAQDPSPYITHMPMEDLDKKVTREQEEPEEEKEPIPEEQPGEGMEPGMDPAAGGGMEGDPGMGGMSGMEDPQAQKLSANQIGRVYELKKIYTRLLAIESYLNRASDDDDIITNLRKKVGEAINLYEVVISNYEQYKDKIDDIIIGFYKFLDKIHKDLNDYFKKLSSKER